MILKLQPAAKIHGVVRVPGDKSVSHRALIFGTIANGTTRVNGFLRAHDTSATMKCLRELGANIEEIGDEIVIVGSGWNGLRATDRVLDCGNSGTTMRMGR